MTKPLPSEIPPPALSPLHHTCAGWQRHYHASQRALTQALHENRVRDECLKIAMEALKAIKVLKWNVSTRWLKIHAASALDEIEQHLAELEPEEETE